MTLIIDPIFYLAAIPAATFLGMSKGGFSGGGMMATPLLALVLPPLQTAAILLPILLLQDVISVFVYRHDWDAQNIKVMLPGAVVGVSAAWLLAAHVSDVHVRLAVGLIALGFVITHGFGRRPATSGRPVVPRGLFWGGVSGFTSMLCQAGGPPFQVMGHSRAADPASRPLVGPAPLLREKVATGKLGMRTGEGFRRWPPEQAEQVRTRLNNFFVEQVRRRKSESFDC